MPALLEYTPYRKGDWTAVRDSMRHGYFAGHDYASVRVDIRGSGDSDGILRWKNWEQEQDDALEVIRWIAQQPWCTGSCGMFGVSWGGYSALQVAARRPAELKAIISVCASDDRYADDIHYVGGTLLALQALSWDSMMLAYNARPPDPAVVGERWREMWLQRMEETPPFIEAVLSHQRCDAFWKQGSVCEDYGAIECPVYAVGGLADCFRDGLFRLLEGLPGPKKGLMGPWGHQYPEDGTPGPRIGFLPEAVRWWDHWLKQVDTGIMDEPLLRVWMQDSVEPRTSYDVRPGRWVAEPAWPSPKIAVKREALRLPEDTISNTSVVGLEAGCWCGFGVCGDFAPDQRREDGLSLCSTSDPLDRSIEVLGFPKVSFTVDSDRPQAQVAVRLCDVHPGGASLLVTRGVLNLTHRKSHEEPSPLTVGEPVRVTITLNSIAHVFPVGHRIRVGISPIYWPWAWPSPEIGTLTISDGELELPVRAGSDGDQPLRPFHVPELARPLAHEIEGTPSSRRRLEHDLATGRSVLTWDHDLSRGVRWKLPDGLEFSSHGGDVFSIVEGKPLSARVRSNWSLRLARDDWRVQIETTGSLSADATTFHAANSLKAYEDDREIFTRSWRFDIPRDQG